jgi:ABC-2 type transport system ATP-binding protein
MFTAAITVRGLSKRFPVRRPWKDAILRPFERQWTPVLQGIDIDVRRGEILGLLGPNGAGKTTFLKILCTTLLPSSGTATVEGIDVVRQPERARQHLGYCLEVERSFYYRLTGVQNLSFFAALNNLPARTADDRIRDVGQLVGIDGYADKPFMTYSRGMRQKMALARALLADPPVLVLDEPTQGLDPRATEEFRRFIRTILAEKLGKTILLVTHSLDEAVECCSRAVLMDQGRLVFEGKGSEVRDHIREHGFPVGSSGEAP